MALTLSSEIQYLIDLISNYNPNETCNELKIKGLIFDFGSVLSHSTQKFVRKLQETALCDLAQKEFNLSKDKTAEFLSQFQKLKMIFNQRKLFLGTGTCLDEGFVLEYTVLIQIMQRYFHPLHSMFQLSTHYQFKLHC